MPTYYKGFFSLVEKAREVGIKEKRNAKANFQN